MKTPAKRPKAKMPPKKKAGRVNDWIVPETSPRATRSVLPARAESKGWGITLAVVICIVLAICLGPYTTDMWKDAYYRFFPTPEMQQLQAMKKSLGLPKAASEDDNDLGCHTATSIFGNHSECDRSITLEFHSSSFVKSLKEQLVSGGWHQRNYDTYGLKTNDETFNYYKRINGEKFCVESQVDSEEDPELPATIWLYAGSDYTCASL